MLVTHIASLKSELQWSPWPVVFLLASVFSFGIVQSAEPVGTKPADDWSWKIQKFYDVRFNEHVDPNQLKASLADLYFPLHPDDVVSNSGNDLISVRGNKRPAVLLIHGGGWVAGDKWTMGSYCDDLSKLGFVVLNINYRLAPQAQFPAQVDDVREGLRYLMKNSDTLCVDLDRIGMFGYSAGGHLSALIGVLEDEPSETTSLTSEWAREDPRWTEIPKVAAVCAGAPPCEFRTMPLDNFSFSYFLKGTRRDYPDLYSAASPTAHVSAGDPPFQIIHGETDLLVPLKTSKTFAAALEAAGATVSLKVIADHGHMLTMMHPTTRKSVAEFFKQQLLMSVPEDAPTQ